MPRWKSAKTKKAAKKRFKITATGKVTRYGAGKRHLLGHKSSKHKRKLSHKQVVGDTHEHHVLDVMPFSHRG
ncbi:MAG TPA: 50S ribosomal protein L35 [Verrucomicrobiae bacterium]|nr:50S ribosomal protein L35 [Verrucomicrobiae bacterium]